MVLICPIHNLFSKETSSQVAESNNPGIIVIPTKVYPTADAPNGSFPVTYRKLLPPSTGIARYPGFAPGKFVLKAGTVRRKGARPLTTDIVFERDVPMKLRDGTTIYTDIFRPVGDGKYPAIFSWSPYGKEIGGQWLDDIPGRSGVSLKLVSELQRFEGADPAYWCAHGYAVVNPDPRGALKSEGNITYWGRQLAEDGYDFVEWIARQPWSDTNVVMSGNSWLGVSQYYIAAERPPHLRAIAPWEGLTDQGPSPGVPVALAFGEMVIQTIAGEGYIEDQPRMILQNPLNNAFWEDHRPRLERIQVPAYIVAIYTNMAHTVGTFDAWRRMGSKEKWLRIHNTQEWTDYYQPDNVKDLRRFFDYYTKGTKNGWETTPKVRMSVLDPGGKDIVNRSETNFPPDRVQLKKLYLETTDSTLKPTASKTDHVLRYAADSKGVTFKHRFDKDTEISGYMKLRLWVEADGSDDMDIAVTVRKVPGLFSGIIQGFMPGPPRNTAIGLLRVSMRELDPVRSTTMLPVLAMRREERLKPGQIVPIEIAISPMAMRYHAGQEMELTISPFKSPSKIPLKFGETRIPFPEDGLTFPPNKAPKMRELGGPGQDAAKRLSTQPPPPRNKGTHILHSGGSYDSYLMISEMK